MTIDVSAEPIVGGMVDKTVLLEQLIEAVVTLTHMESCHGVQHQWARDHIANSIADQKSKVEGLVAQVSERMK